MNTTQHIREQDAAVASTCSKCHIKQSLTVLFAASLTSGTCQTQAESIHIGGGASYTYFYNTHPSMTSGFVPVYQVLAGSRDGLTGSDFIFSWGSFSGSGEGVEEYYYPSTDVDYFATDALFTFYFNDSEHRRTTSWFSLGTGVHFFALEGAYYPAYGFQFVLGLGLDYRLSDSLFIRGGLNTSWYSTRDLWLDEIHTGATAGLSIAVLYRFEKKLGGEEE